MINNTANVQNSTNIDKIDRFNQSGNFNGKGEVDGMTASTSSTTSISTSSSTSTSTASVTLKNVSFGWAIHTIQEEDSAKKDSAKNILQKNKIYSRLDKFRFRFSSTNANISVAGDSDKEDLGSDLGSDSESDSIDYRENNNGQKNRSKWDRQKKGAKLEENSKGSWKR